MTLHRLLVPLFVKELRTSLRSRMASAIAALVVCGLSVVAFAFFVLRGGFGSAAGSEIGVGLLSVTTWLLMGVILLACPLLAAGCISGEKEQKTFDSLAVAPVARWHIVVAKHAATTAYFSALIFVSLPILSSGLIFGGVSPWTVLEVCLCLFATTIFTGAVGLFWSACFSRSVVAVPLASITVIGFSMLLIIGPWALAEDSSITRLLSPVYLLSSILGVGHRFFFGAEIPVAVPGIALLVAGTLPPLVAACLRLEFESERRFVLFRSTFLLALVVFVLMFMGNVERTDGRRFLSVMSQAVDGAQTALLLLICLGAGMAPWLGAASHVTDSDRMTGARANHPRTAWLRCAMLDGAGFLAVFQVVGCLMGLAALEACGVRAPLMQRFVMAWGACALLPSMAVNWLARVAATGGGALRKWAGLVVVYVFIATLLLAGPMAMMSSPALSAILPLSPVIGYMWIEPKGLAFLEPSDGAPWWSGKCDPMLVTVAFYGAIALASLGLLAVRRLHRRNGERADLPVNGGMTR